MSTLTHFDEQAQKSNPKAALVRVEFRDAQGYGNQRKHDLRIGPQPAYVNPDLRDLNRILIEPMPTKDIKQLAKERRDQRDPQRAMKGNAGVAISGLIGFGIEAQVMFNALAPETQDQALRDVVNRIAAEWNTTVTGLVLHRDETAPHAHFSLCGYDLTGVPLSNVIKRGKLHNMQTYIHEILQDYMPELGRGRTRQARLQAGAAQHEVVNRSVAELHHDLPLEIAQRQQELDALLDDIRVAEEKLRKNQDLAKKAEVKALGDGERAEKAARNLARYQARQEAAQAEIAKLEEHQAELQPSIKALQIKAQANQDAARRDREVAAAERQALAAERQAINAEMVAVARQKEEVMSREAKVQALQAEAERAQLEAQQCAADAAETAVRAVAGIIQGTVRFDEKASTWRVSDKALLQKIKPIFKAMQPALERMRDFWADFQARIVGQNEKMDMVEDVKKSLKNLDETENPKDDDDLKDDGPDF